MLMAHPKLATRGDVITQRLEKLGISIRRAMAGTDLPADPDPLESGVPDAFGKACKADHSQHTIWVNFLSDVDQLLTITNILGIFSI